MTTQDQWIKHVGKWRDCQRCPLGKQRGNICLARGNLPCDVLFIGEAPGMSEDAWAQPFVGPAGQLLDKIIARSLPAGTSCAMTNLVACFPREAKSRGDNEPERGEILECRPRLVEFVNIARPRLVVTVGTLAEQYVGEMCPPDCPRVHIIHPAAILAHMPMAQKGFAVQKCVVQVSNAYSDVLQADNKFQPWETEHAGGKARREQLRRIYQAAEGGDLSF